MNEQLAGLNGRYDRKRSDDHLPTCQPSESKMEVSSQHGCCWETFHVFAYCGLVVEIPHLTAKM